MKQIENAVREYDFPAARMNGNGKREGIPCGIRVQGSGIRHLISGA
jgi:hypothetical protein